MDFRSPDDYDLGVLDDYLWSEDLPDEAMLLSELDGYLTAVAISPNLILPSEWLPAIWDDEDPPFADKTEANAIYGAITGLYNDVLRALAGDAASFEPILMDDLDGTRIADLWIQGFVRGLSLRPEDWKPLFDTEDGQLALLPFMALCPNPDGTYEVDMSDEERDRLAAEVLPILPDCVAMMRDFWLEKGLGPRTAPPPRRDASPRSLWLARSSSPQEPIRRPAGKVGRNDLCPCGSGKKYKRCCGA
jgi:uncharacterized protein